MGVDVVQLLKGGTSMIYFRNASAEQNPVLQYVGAAHLLEKEEPIFEF